VAERKGVRNEQDREAKAAGIVRAARAVVGKRGYAGASVQEIADTAGVAKGTVFLYFSSKETLGLAVLRQVLSEWWEDVDSRLKQLERPGSPSTVAAAVRRSLDGGDELFSWLGMLADVLEVNADPGTVIRFRQELLDGARRLGLQMEAVLPFLKRGEGLEVGLTLHAMMIGIHQITAGRMSGAMPTPELAPFRVDAAGAVGRTLRIQLEGARAVTAQGAAPAT
jgi:AcrR family transcriptional regulator